MVLFEPTLTSVTGELVEDNYGKASKNLDRGFAAASGINVFLRLIHCTKKG